jgi:hypothetical protein
MVGLVGVSLAGAAFNTPDPIPGHVRFVGIDLDVSGNTFSSVASHQNTGSVAPGGTITVDIVVDEIHPSDGIAAVEGTLVYDAASLHVVSIDPGSMVYESLGTPFSYSETLPDTDGRFDFNHGDIDENTDESGEGVLARITLQCDVAGTSVLSLGYWFGETDFRIYKHVPGEIEPIPIQAQGTATVFCGTTPTPTPTPPPTPICSPAPHDVDCDGIQNEFDNCPTVANPGQLNHDGDSMGDLCDPDDDNDGVNDGADNCPTMHNPEQGVADEDGDGEVCDNCPRWPNPSQVLPDWPVPAGDEDCDGFPGGVAASGTGPETYIGTDRNMHCAASGVPNDESVPDAWPADFNDNQIVSGQDVGVFAPAYGNAASAGPFGTANLPGVRFDFNGNGIINGQDIGKFSFYYNKTCA